MKLWHKIFLGIFLTAFFVVILYGCFQIYENHKDNLRREQERSLGEMELLAAAIDNAEEIFGGILPGLQWYGKYYEDKGIYFSFYKKEECIYQSLEGIELEIYASMLDVKNNQRKLRITKADHRYYIMTAGRRNSEEVLFYLRDITAVYEDRKSQIWYLSVWLGIFLAVTALVALLISKALTRPLKKLEQSAGRVNEGNYEIFCAQGTDEIGRLGAAFNSMARAVEEREENLREEADRKQQFIEAMTHEINTPLTSILGYAQLLKTANCTRQQQIKALENIESEARRIQQMYQKLMQLHKIRAEGWKAEPVKLRDLEADLRQDLDQLFAKQQVRVEFQWERQTVNSDYLLLYILLSNLLRNAALYSDRGGRVRVCAENCEDGFVLRVQDWGRGIPAEAVERVTEPFYRVDKSRSRQTGGSGIGLYLCRQIVEQLGGWLEIHSAEEKGTTVTARFPRNVTALIQPGNTAEESSS